MTTFMNLFTAFTTGTLSESEPGLPIQTSLLETSRSTAATGSTTAASHSNNGIPTLNVTSNVVGAIIFVLLLLVVLLGLGLCLAVYFVRRRSRGIRQEVHHQDLHISPIKLSRNKSYVDISTPTDYDYYVNDPLYAQPREEGPSAHQSVVRYETTGPESKSPQLNTEDDAHDYEDI